MRLKNQNARAKINIHMESVWQLKLESNQHIKDESVYNMTANQFEWKKKKL